jgi:tuftelin-interacting protein 11
VRLQQIQLVANDINNLAKELASVYEVSLEPFTPLVYKLVDQFAQEFDRYGLDEIVVAAIAPLVRRMTTSWDPLKEPKEFISVFRGWRRALKVNKNVEEQEDSRVDVYGARMKVTSPPLEV